MTTTLSELPFVTSTDITDRWMEAWHGGVVVRDNLSRARAGVTDREYEPYWAQKLASGTVIRDGYSRYRDYAHVTTLPEAAFDWPIYRAAILAPVTEVLYPDANPDAEWEVETIEWVAAAVADVLAAKPFTAPKVDRCPDCGHGTEGKHAGTVEPCFDCEDAAGVGEYAPCSVAFDFKQEA